MSNGGMSSVPGGGDMKPKLDDKLGAAEHAKESNLTSGGDGDAAGGPTKAERIGNAASKVSEAANDIKDVAKAGPTGLESTAKEIKEGAQKGGAKGAAAAAGREAAGQAVAATATAFTAGALGEVYGKIAKGVSKALKKENFSKILFLMVGIGLLPTSIIVLLIILVVYAAANPAKFVQQVLTDPKSRDFAFQAAAAAGKTFLSSEDVLKKYGYVENKPGVAVAATPATSPKPGSLEYKISKINLKNAQYQTNNAPDCPYRYTTKEMVGPDGNKTYVVDKVYDKQGSEIAKEGILVNYCIVQSMPLYNLMIRTQQARDVNKFSNTILSYADSDNSPNLKDKTPQQIKEYVHNKTYQRITSPADTAPTLANFGGYDLQKQVEIIRQQLSIYDGDPDSINFEFVGDPNDNRNIASTLCAFSWGYLTDSNLQKALLSRINAGQRSGVKWNTIASTRQLGKMSNEELNPTYSQIENWQASTAYYQNLYGGLSGQLINPENLGNTAYGSGYVQAMSLLFDIRNNCDPRNPKDINPDAILADYNGLKQIITEESNGKFISPNDFGLEQLMIGILRTSAGASVSGLESGPQNFNNQSQGFRALSNQYTARMGGRFMNSAESTQQSLAVENVRREVENKNGLAYRLFGKDNIRSLANISKYQMPKTNGEIRYQAREMIAQLSNPIKMLADIHSNFSYVALGKINKAFAASAVGDAYMRLDTVGLPVSEFQGVDLIANSNEIQDLQEKGSPQQKSVLSYFDKCSKSNIPSKAVFARLYDPKIVTIDKLSVVRNGASEEIAVIEKLKENLIYQNVEGVEIPSYPAINVNNWASLGFSNKEEFIACEIYMMPPTNHEVIRDYVNTGLINKLFGFDIRELAKKYHLYLYANSVVDLMVELSNNDQNNSIYASSSTATDVAQTISTDVSGSVVDLAKQIIANPNVTYEAPNIKSQFTDLAEGKNPVPCGSINPEILKLVINLAASHSLQINSLARGRDCYPQSWHGSGGAIDVGKFDNEKLNGNNDASNKFINAVIAAIPPSSKTGFGDCDGHILPSAGKQVNFFADECTHVHVQMEFNAARKQ